MDIAGENDNDDDDVNVVADDDDDDEDDGNEFVTINVSGKRYETRWNTLRSKCRSFLFSFHLSLLVFFSITLGAKG